MTDEPTAGLAALRASTADLVRDLSGNGWSDDDARGPSRCAGWTRGHVLTHLARNADGIAGTLAGALRGEVVPRYPDGWDARDRDIAAGADRSLADLRTDVDESAERLDRVFAAVTEAGAWDAETDGGRPAREWLSRRQREVEIHRVDLDDGYLPDQWPALLVAALLPAALESVPGRSANSLRVRVDGDGSVVPEFAGREWTIGSGDPIDVTGPDWALAAWATGRGDLVAGRLSATPALEPWR